LFEKQNRREATLYRIEKENLTHNAGNQASVSYMMNERQEEHGEGIRIMSQTNLTSFSYRFWG